MSGCPVWTHFIYRCVYPPLVTERLVPEQGKSLEGFTKSLTPTSHSCRQVGDKIRICTHKHALVCKAVAAMKFDQ